MTTQPNESKQGLTPEFQDEAQHAKSGDRNLDKTPGKTDPRHTSAAANADVAPNKDAPNKDKDTAALSKDPALNDAAAKDKDTLANKDSLAKDAVTKDAVTNKDTAHDRQGDAQRTESQRADAQHAEGKRTDARTDAAVARKDDHAKDKADTGARHTTDDKKPGVPQTQSPDATRTRLFQDQDVTKYREQWRELQAGFVDEPRSAVREADTLVSKMLDTLTSQLTEQKRALQSESDAEDTERLRVAMQRYRSLFDQMLQV